MEDEFLVAGSTSGDSDERMLNQVVRIAGYTATIRQLVDQSFGYCPVHHTPIPKESRGAHARCLRRRGPRFSLDPVRRAGLR